jgi:hypothetical protein
MFATILQQDTPTGIQQVVIVPLQDGNIRRFTRDGKGLRGTAGAWRELSGGDVLSFVGDSVGVPMSVALTPADYQMLQFPITPTVLVQKLVRTVKDMDTVSGRPFHEVYDEVMDAAIANPAVLAKYLVATPVVVSPSIQVVPVPVEQPVVLEPAYAGVASQPLSEPIYELPTVGLPPTTESEPDMDYSTIVASTAENGAVLTVPDVKPYFTRKFFGLTEEQIYDNARSKQDNVLLTGDAGTGKTSSARNYAAIKGLPFVTIECTQQIDQTVTQGRFVPTGVGNTTRWKYSQLATAIQQPSVILINELTRMTPKAAPLFLSLLEERELRIDPLNEVIKVHPDVLFIADQNTGIGYTGTSRQDAALIDRFGTKLEFTYDTNIESNFIPSFTLLGFASNIREASEMNDEFSVPMSTRILKNFVSHATSLNFEFAVNSLLSNYPKMDGERDAIKMRFDAEAPTIANELGVSIGKYSTN